MENGEDTTTAEEQEIFGFLPPRERLGLYKGEPVYARRVTLAEQVAYEDEIAAIGENGKSDNKRYGEAVVRYLAMVIVDDEGDRVFAAKKDLVYLRGRPYAEIEPLFKRASKFNAFGLDDIAAIEKNSGSDLGTA